MDEYRQQQALGAPIKCSITLSMPNHWTQILLGRKFDREHGEEKNSPQLMDCQPRLSAACSRSTLGSRRVAVEISLNMTTCNTPCYSRNSGKTRLLGQRGR